MRTNSNSFRILDLAEGESGDAAVSKIIENKTAKEPPSARKEGNARGDDGKRRGFLANRSGYEEGRRHSNGGDNYYNVNYKKNRQQYYNDRSIYYNGRYNGNWCIYSNGRNGYYNGRGSEEDRHYKSILSMTKHYGQHHHVKAGFDGRFYHYPWHQRANYVKRYKDGTRQVGVGYSTATRRIYKQKERVGMQCMSEKDQRDGGEANIGEANANNCNIVANAETAIPTKKSNYNRDVEEYKRDALKVVVTGQTDSVARNGYAGRSDCAPKSSYSDKGNNGLKEGYTRRGNRSCNIIEFLKPADIDVYYQPSPGYRPRRDIYRDGGDSGIAPGRGNSGFMGHNYHHNGEGYRKYAPRKVVTARANRALSSGYASPYNNMPCGGYNGRGSNESREGYASRHNKGGLRSGYSGHDQHSSLPNLDSEAQFPALVPAKKKVELESQG